MIPPPVVRLVADEFLLCRVEPSSIPGQPGEEVCLDRVTLAGVDETLEQVSAKLATARAQEARYLAERRYWEDVKKQMKSLSKGG